jgi:hypothetical protein
VSIGSIGDHFEAVKEILKDEGFKYRGKPDSYWHKAIPATQLRDYSALSNERWCQPGVKFEVISTTGESLHEGECGPAKSAASQTKCDAPKKPEERLQLDTHRSITITPAQAARGCKARVQTETGTKIVLSIPKNTRSGTKLRVAGRGKKMDGRVGDLYLRVDIR